MIHHFCEFSTVIQLAATFNLGCIALSGKNSFAKSLANYFFKVNFYMNKTLSDMRQLISTDQESMEKITPIVIDKHDYKNEIEILKKKFKSLKCSTNLKYNIIKKEIDNKYTPKYLDSICILLGIYSVFELIFSFFIKIEIESCVLSFYTLNIVTCLLVLFYLTCEITNYFLLFHQFKKTSCFSIKESKTAASLSVLSLIIALVFPVLNKLFKPIIPCNQWIGEIHFYIGLLLPFTGFILYWIYIQILSMKAKKYIREELLPMKNNFEELHKRKNEIDIILTEFGIASIVVESTELKDQKQ